MKFTIETKALSEALGVASVAVNNRMSLPILGNVKIQATSLTVQLSTTDLDMFVEQSVPAKIAKQGATTVSFDMLHRLVSRLSAKETEVTLSGTSMRIKSGDVSAVLEALHEQEFPETPLQSEGESVACDAKELLTPLSKVEHAMRSDAGKYELMGVNIQDGQFVATDGRRLAGFTGVKLNSESAIAPTKFVKAMLKIAPTGNLAVKIGDGLISVVSETVRLTCKLVEGQFPQNAMAIAKTKPGEDIFSCERRDLIEALRTCSVFRDGMLNGLSVTGKGKEIEVANGEKIKVMVMGSELTGQPDFSKKFNATYMLDALSVLEKDSVAIHCAEAHTTLVIQEGAFISVIQGMIPLAQ